MQAGVALEQQNGEPVETVSDLNDIQLRWMRLCDIEAKREMMGEGEDGDLPDPG